MEIKFEVWNKRWDRLATEEEFNEHVHIRFRGIGYVEKAKIYTTGDIEIRHLTHHCT